jgi:hypothetical protein
VFHDASLRGFPVLGWPDGEVDDKGAVSVCSIRALGGEPLRVRIDRQRNSSGPASGIVDVKAPAVWRHDEREERPKEQFALLAFSVELIEAPAPETEERFLRWRHHRDRCRYRDRDRRGGAIRQHDDGDFFRPHGRPD